MNSLEKVKESVKILDSKKGYDIDVIEIGDVTAITDYFVICTGNSEPQLKALADEVEYQMKERGVPVGHIEGYATASWILLDYSDVIVHIFHKESRMYYSLERLWTDAKKVDVSEWISE